MSYEITEETEAVIAAFRQLASELDEEWLSKASPDARAQWQTYLRLWPTSDDLRRGVVGLSLDDLSWMLSKARRFRELLQAQGAPGHERHQTQ